MKKTVFVGGNLRDIGKRFVHALRKSEQTKKFIPEENVTFMSWEALSAVMSEKRYELLIYLRKHPTKGIRALARALNRDYKRVHTDVKALMAVSLIDDKAGILRADYDEIQTTIKLRKAA